MAVYYKRSPKYFLIFIITLVILIFYFTDNTEIPSQSTEKHYETIFPKRKHKVCKSFSLNSFQKTNQKSDSSCVHINKHSTCFLGRIFCHPGFTGDRCETRMVPANPWYTAHCPNLAQDLTYNVQTPITEFSNGKNCSAKSISGITGCAHLCYSHPLTGVAQVPLAFWIQVQKNENLVWKGGMGGSDRGQEHLEGFDNFTSLPGKLT